MPRGAQGQSARTGTPRHTLWFITRSDNRLYRERRQASGLGVTAGSPCQRWGSLSSEHGGWGCRPPAQAGRESTHAFFVCTAHRKDHFWQADRSSPGWGQEETSTLSCGPVSLGWQSPIMTLFWVQQPLQSGTRRPPHSRIERLLAAGSTGGGLLRARGTCSHDRLAS